MLENANLSTQLTEKHIKLIYVLPSAQLPSKENKETLWIPSPSK